MIGKFLAVSLASFIFCSCSIRGLMVDQAADLIENGVTAFEQDADLDMLQKAFPANIKLCEALLANSPKNVKMLVLLSRMYGSYAYSFIEPDYEQLALKNNRDNQDENRIKTLKNQLILYYTKGTDYASAALEIRLGQKCENLFSTDDAVPCFEKASLHEIPEIFWFGFNLGSWISLQRDDYEASSKTHIAVDAMRKVKELDPDYFHNGAGLFFLGYYASLPEHMGGNLEKAMGEYQEIKKRNGEKFHLADLLYARFVLTRENKRQKFLETLKPILSSDPEKTPYPLMNKVAAEKARIYLENIENLF